MPLSTSRNSTISPKVSIIIPTLNSAKVLDNCLQSIRHQNYPQNKIIILVIDGGSTDSTLNIAQKHNCQIIANPLKTAESAKAIGISHSSGKFIAFIDSDNILPDINWLNTMLLPFSISPEIIGSEPIEFTYRSKGGFIERYSALFGANDPYAYYLGNYDRINQINYRWTGINISTTEFPGYVLVTLKPKTTIPTIGANGTIFRSEFLKNNFKGDYLFDIDVISQVIDKTNQNLHFAKVKVGIIHTYCESSISKFIKKQTRRVKDIFTFQNLRTYNWDKKPFYSKNILFGLYSILLIPSLIDSFRGYKNKPDLAWFFHPLACFLTIWIYAYFTFLHTLGFNFSQSRNKWQQ